VALCCWLSISKFTVVTSCHVTFSIIEESGVFRGYLDHLHHQRLVAAVCCRCDRYRLTVAPGRRTIGCVWPFPHRTAHRGALDGVHQFPASPHILFRTYTKDGTLVLLPTEFSISGLMSVRAMRANDQSEIRGISIAFFCPPIKLFLR